jgi:hypothetical protein
MAVKLITGHSIGFVIRSKNLKLLKIKCVVEKHGLNLYPAKDDAGKRAFRSKARYCGGLHVSHDSPPMLALG